MLDTREMTITIDYKKAEADLNEVPVLEACILLQSAQDRIRRLTGMEPEKFIEGMREMMAPVNNGR